MLQELVKAAMMGTSKYVPTAVPVLLQEVNDKITATSEDREDAFLKLAAAYLLLEEAGSKLSVNTNRQPTAPEEPKLFVSAQASALLQQFIKNKEEPLVDYFIFRCLTSEKVVLPVLLPELLTRAVEKKQQRGQLLQACGTRGKWLSGINPLWQKLLSPVGENIWETGTWEQRKSFFKTLRQINPAEALALLQANLQEETANNRAELLELLQQGLSLADEAFLTLQLSDKSTKVKQVAYELLKSLPGSALYQALVAFVKEAVQIREERVLLITKKKVLHINEEAVLSEELFASGFEKVSSLKGIQDADHWLAQAITYLHPRFWQDHYQFSSKETVQHFANHKAHALWLPSLVQSAIRYRHQEMAVALLETEAVTAINLLEVLPLEDRFKWVAQYRQQANQYLPLLLDEHYTLLPADVCRELLQQFIQQPYGLSQQDYFRWALQMPSELLPTLQQYVIQENETYQVRYFKNFCAEMGRIIQTREQINASI